MYFHIMTLFPEMVLGGLNESITGKAIEKGLIGVDAVNIRDFAGNRYGHVDDYTYGGGAGMLMQPGPVYDAYQHVLAQIAVRKEKKGTSAQAKKVRVLYMTPQGQPFKQCMAEEYAKEEDLVLLCGHYEGIDERVLEMIFFTHLSFKHMIEALRNITLFYLQSSATTALITLPSALPFNCGITVFMIIPLFFVAITSAHFSVRNAFTSSSLIRDGAYSLMTS